MIAGANRKTKVVAYVMISELRYALEGKAGSGGRSGNEH